MTQTLRRPPRQNSGVRRKGRIYLFTTLRVHESGTRVGLVLDGTTEDGYVGKTRQTLAQREQQHRGGSADGEPVPGEDLEEQPWWDISVGGIQLLEQGFWTDDELAERETFWIHQVKPRYNYVENLDNKNRIPKFTAREHRDNRDRAKGLTPRQWAPFKSQSGPAVRPAIQQSPRRKRKPMPIKWRRRRNSALVWLGSVPATWLLLALVGTHVHAPWRTWPILSLAACTLAPILWRCRKRNRAAWTVAVAVAMVALWVVTG